MAARDWQPYTGGVKTGVSEDGYANDAGFYHPIAKRSTSFSPASRQSRLPQFGSAARLRQPGNSVKATQPARGCKPGAGQLPDLSCGLLLSHDFPPPL